MNVAQALRQSLFDINGVLQDGTTDPFYKLQPMLSWATDGNSKLEKALRTAKEDYGLILLQSNDVAYTWCGVTYSPSSLTMVEGQKMYTLPPDLLLVKSLRPVDDDAVVFQFKDVSDPAFEPLDTETVTGANLIYFDVVGENTLLLGSDPPDGLEVEIAYISRSGPLQIESTGTISVNFGSAVVSGAGTAWVVNGLRPNLELIISADATAPKILSQTAGGTFVDPSLQYYPVNEVTGDGTLSLLANWSAASVANKGYMLATVPTLPKEHHQALVDYVCYRALRSRRSSASETFQKSYKSEVDDMRKDTGPRQEQSPVFIEDWNP